MNPAANMIQTGIRISEKNSFALAELLKGVNRNFSIAFFV